MSRRKRPGSTTETELPVLLNASLNMPEKSNEFDPDVPSRENILAFFRQHNNAQTLEDIIKFFKLTRETAINGLERRIVAMKRDGQLEQIGENWLMVQSNLQTIRGLVQGHRDGFGFLIPDDKAQADIFLTPREMLKVMHGDYVLVKPTGIYKGKPEGSIIEVLKRGTSKLVGRLLQEQGQYVVAPEDQRIKHDIVVSSSDLGDASPGQIVTVEIVRQPTRLTAPHGRIIEVLGEIDDPGMEIEIAVRKFNVPQFFSEAALEQADKLPDEVSAVDLKNRVDLRDVPFITIDGEDARDFDDAVYAELIDISTGTRTTQDKKAWRLLVAIADVSHYVMPQDSLDKDAIERGTSVYFPRRVIPMLPEKLSNGLCSLNPKVDRLALVCDMIIPISGAKKGKVQAYQFYDAVINSHARTTYTQIWDALVNPKGASAHELADVLPQINGLYELYQLLAEQRKVRGAMDFDTIETKIICNDMGKIEQIVPFHRNNAHRLIEECMLAANTCAADFMHRNKREGLYRVHEGPTPERLAAFKEFLKSTGLDLGGGTDPQSMDYAKLIDQAKARDDFQIVQSMAMRSMQQAIYSPDNAGHFGLAYPVYTHFTSPIRRYPDLLTHRVIKSILHKGSYTPYVQSVEQAKGESKKAYEHAVWEHLGIMLSATERRADEASYDVQAWLKCWYIREHVGEVFSGTVTGVTTFGLFVTLNTMYVEGLVHISELGADYYQYNEQFHELRGERTGKRYRLTDQVQVQVTRVDLEARRIEFVFVKSTSYDSVRKELQGTKSTPRVKRVAKPKPAALRGSTASQRRAAQQKVEAPAPAKRRKNKKSTRSRR